MFSWSWYENSKWKSPYSLKALPRAEACFVRGWAGAAEPPGWLALASWGRRSEIMKNLQL